MINVYNSLIHIKIYNYTDIIEYVHESKDGSIVLCNTKEQKIRKVKKIKVKRRLRFII